MHEFSPKEQIMSHYYQGLSILCSLTLLTAVWLTSSQRNNQALLEAVKQGKEENVKKLLKRGADPNTRDAYGDTVLMLEIRDHVRFSLDPTIIQALLQAEANIDIANEDGWTALMFAVELGAPIVVQLLLQAGANPHLKNRKGQNAHDIALKYGFREKILSLLSNPSILTATEAQVSPKNNQQPRKGQKEKVKELQKGSKSQ